MAVMLQTRNLRVSPDGDATDVVAPAGKKVEITDDSDDSFVKIRFSDGDQLREGWVSGSAVDPASDSVTGPLDKLIFAESCVRKSVIWGVNAHYLMSVAEMRTHITVDSSVGGDVGPFALSPSEWAFYSALPDFQLGFSPDEINNWRLQCALFSVMILNAQQKISSLIGDQPTYSQLYLAQILGTKVASAAIKDLNQTLSTLLGAAASADFQAEGIDAGRIQNRYAAIVEPSATAVVTLQRIDAALQSALDATRPLILQVAGSTIDAPPSESKSPTIVTPTVVTPPGQFSKLLGFIAQPESGGNPNAFFGNSGNQSNPKFTAMTIAEVLNWQRNFVRMGHPSSAVGKYQFMPATLGTLRDHGIVSNQDTLDERTQDKLAVALMNGRGLKQFLAKTLSAEDFGVNLAMEWASMPVPKNVLRPTKGGGAVLVHTGQSYYAGDGLNKALVPVDKFMAAIQSALV